MQKFGYAVAASDPSVAVLIDQSGACTLRCTVILDMCFISMFITFRHTLLLWGSFDLLILSDFEHSVLQSTL